MIDLWPWLVLFLAKKKKNKTFWVKNLTIINMYLYINIQDKYDKNNFHHKVQEKSTVQEVCEFRDVSRWITSSAKPDIAEIGKLP